MAGFGCLLFVPKCISRKERRERKGKTGDIYPFFVLSAFFAVTYQAAINVTPHRLQIY